MKNFLLIFIVVMGLLPACNTQNKTTSQTARKDTLPVKFYKRFEGTIAGKPVVMHLHKTNNKYEGVYYYRNIGRWLYLNADSISGNTILFIEIADAYNEYSDQDTLHAQLDCKFIGDSLSGTWQSADRKTSYPINLKEVYPTGTYRFSIEEFSDSLKAFPAKEGTPMAELNFSFVRADDNNWINNEIKRMIGFDSPLNFNEGFTKKRNEYFADYKKELPPALDSNDVQRYNYSETQNIYVRYNENDLVILESADYIYSGGVHGNYGSTFYCYDIAAKKQLHLPDVLSADSVTMQQIMEKYFRIQYNVKEDSLNQVLFENHLAANQNFYFTEKGIGFLYNPYEVASYAQGEISVFIPFTELQKYLQLSFKKRLKIN